MSEHVIGALEDQVRAQVKAIENMTLELRKVMGPLEQLPELTRLQADTIIKVVTQQTKTLAEMELAAQSAELAGYKATGESMQAQMERLLTDLREELEEVKTRYARIQADLSDLAERRIRDLDAPCLKVMEDELPWLRQQYVGGLLPSASILAAEAELCAGLRGLSLGEQMSQVTASLEEILRSRAQVEDVLAGKSDGCLEGGLGGHRRDVTMPFVCVQQNEQTLMREVILDNKALLGRGEWSTFLVEECQGERLRLLHDDPLPPDVQRAILDRATALLCDDLLGGVREGVAAMDIARYLQEHTLLERVHLEPVT